MFNIQNIDVLTAAKSWRINKVNNIGEFTFSSKEPTKDISQIFASDVFTIEKMREKLSKEIWKSLWDTIEKAKPLDHSVADMVALAMKEWATERGATHYTHWFQPLTGSTAEKHESFITPNENGKVIAEFSGKDLIQSEPDASSFPSGGLRSTFEARGYTAWDPTSPAFIMRHSNGATLCIPTAFASWTGDALDNKIPLLRSTEALNKAAIQALNLLGVENVSKVFSTVGAEQEYFLIDEEFFYRRPDLSMCGRTLFGAKPPRGQELEDHYFGSIPDRVLSFMTDVEFQLYQLGVPVKTRHNEVAPGQYEIAPIFEHCNSAADHQQILMQVLQNTARKYGLVCLFHEKPFAGVNGSGKHLNWSLSTDCGKNLLEPGETPSSNTQFLYFCAAVIKAVDKHQDLLRISVASPSNDHRLGANEAPPAIISIFLGDELTNIFDQLEKNISESTSFEGLLGLGTDILPKIPRHTGDRNRTSPFAFTGNKFEFRAVGASQSISFPITILNTIVADAIDEMNNELKSRLSEKTSKEKAIREVIKKAYSEHKRIIFNGDGYSDEWKIEAKNRGLLNIPNSLDAIMLLISDKNLKLFEKHNVLSNKELEARFEVKIDKYFKVINIEGETTEWVAQTMLLPDVLSYLNELFQTLINTNQNTLSNQNLRRLVNEYSSLVDDFIYAIEELRQVNIDLGGDSILEKANHMKNNVLPNMNYVRSIADKLERLTADRKWSLPGYREMLFVK